jgi:N-acetylmuramoyl-L-alanine amidase
MNAPAKQPVIRPMWKTPETPLHVIIDAGHGWNTPGKNSDDAHYIDNNNQGRIIDTTLREFEYNETIANKLAMLLHLSFLQGNPISYSFTAQEHYDVSLVERVKRANKLYAQYKNTHRVIFLSIHANAFGNKAARGHSVHIAKQCSKTSKRFAELVDIGLTYLNDVFKTGIYSRGVLRDNFYVIKNTHCPAILVESAFMTNPEDLKWLLDENYRNAIATTLFNCLVDYSDLGTTLQLEA